MALKKLLIIFAILFSTFVKLSGQINAFDSLFYKLGTFKTNDTNYINTLTSFGIRYQYRNSDSMLLIGDNIIKLSSQLNYTKGLGDGYKIKGIAYINLQNKTLALINDSIALAYYTSINNYKGIGSVYNNMAVLFNAFGEYRTAIDFYHKSIKFRQLVNDQKGISECYNNMGNNLLNVGNYDDAVEHLLKALTIRKQLNDLEGISNSYYNLGNVYYYMKEFNKAEEYYWKSYELKKGIGSENEVTGLYVNIGSLHFRKNNHDSAYYYFKKALKWSKADNDISTIIISLNNMAELELANNKFKETLKIINELETYIDLNIENENKIVFLTIKSDYYDAVKDYINAIKYGKMALTTAIKTNTKKSIVEAAELLSKLYEKNGNEKEALAYYKISRNYADSIFNEASLTTLNDFEYRYKVQGKEQEILKLEAKSKLEIEANKQLKLGFILLFVVLLCVLVLTYFININRKKEIHINELYLTQKQTLEQHNVFKDKIFTIIAHDLRAPVANLKNIFNLLDDELISDEEFTYLKKSLNDQVSSLSLLLDNLLLWAKNQMESGFVTNKTDVSVNKLIERNKLLFTEIANKKEVTLESKIEDEITLNADTDQLDLIIRNLLSNAIKFSHQNGIVSINASQTNENVILKIKDNGVGMTQETIESIYNNKIVSKQGTLGEKGTGLGINLTSEFIESNNGTFSINSEPEIGTEIIIEFKKTLV